MNCEEYKKIIERHVEGVIEETELADLKVHIESCENCAREFEVCRRLERMVNASLSVPGNRKDASFSVLAAIEKHCAVGASRAVRLQGWMAVAASFLLVCGLVLGFAFGRARPVVPTQAKAGMQVSELEGLVLVKHADAEVWEELSKQSHVYVGDVFHSAGKASLRLQCRQAGVVTLTANSILELKSYNGGTEFYLSQGELAAALEEGHPPFVVSTVHGRVEALGTEFTVSVD